MPWFQAPPTSTSWGWHWTMGHFHPDTGAGTRSAIASHYYPLIGPYDSSDPDVLEYHALTMKVSGIDGAIIDWYGTADVYDYGTSHRNTLLFIKALKQAGLKFGICFEDQTLPNLQKFGKVPDGDTTKYGKNLLAWMDSHWFSDPSYVRMDGKPILLVFGPQYYKGDEWPSMKGNLNLGIYGVNEPFKFDNGGFAWPWPASGLSGTQHFYPTAAKRGSFIGDAYPRFNDIYGDAKVHDSFPTLPDDDGKTFKKTFEWARSAGSKLIQLVTWNDWGEGTQIEPSTEFGFRDLEFLQTATDSKFSKSDLELPLAIYKQRKKGGDAKLLDAASAKLDAASAKLAAGDPASARKLLKM